MYNIELNRRESKNIEKKKVSLPDIESKRIIDVFLKNIQMIKGKFQLVKNLYDKGFENEAEDLLRSQIVFSMSALDYYLHEITRYSILKMFNGEKEKTKNYETFIVSLKVVEEALKNPERVDWLEEEIHHRHSNKTFMGSSNIKEVLKLNSTKEVYRNVAAKIDDNQAFTKEMLDEIYKRRNQIVHQSDSQLASNQMNLITIEEVEKYVIFIEKFILYVHDEIVQDFE